MLNKETLDALAARIGTKTLGLVGDLCVDIYWEADMTRSELSRETPHFPLPVVRERVYPGAGGNVAMNLAALGPRAVRVVSVCGDDWRGALLRRALAGAVIGDAALIEVPGRFTNAYCKPLRHGISDVVYEDPRLDFESRTPLPQEAEDRLLAALSGLAAGCDAVCVSDQFLYGCVTPRVRAALTALARSVPVIADSRYRIADFSGCILKPNEVECVRAVDGPEAPVSTDPGAVCRAADALARRNGAGVLCTLGAAGSYFTDGDTGFRTPAFPVSGPVDVCGAGDTSLAAFTAALAAGASYADAAAFAAAASCVTVRKCGVTGTATVEEIRAVLA